MKKMTVSLVEFEKSLKALESALNIEKNDIARDATIQRFEFCAELTWETTEEIMGASTTDPMQVIREVV